MIRPHSFTDRGNPLRCIFFLTLMLMGGCPSSQLGSEESDCPTCESNRCSETECDFMSDCRVCPSAWNTSQAEEEILMLELVNNARRNGLTCPSGVLDPVAELSMDMRLRAAARLHALDMGEHNFFSHDSRDGREPWDRMEETGYEGTAFGENIAAGSDLASITFDQWKSSDGHCRNMMDPQFNEIGIGFAVVDGSEYTNYWVQKFAQGADEE